MSRRFLPRPATLAVTSAAVLMVISPTPAFAHNSLVGSDPKDGSSMAVAPDRAVLEFNEAAQAFGSRAIVTGPGGSRWEKGAIRIEGRKVTVPIKPLGPVGQYVVAYRVVSADGHPIAGQVKFTLTQAGTSPAPTAAAASSPSPAVVSPPPSPSSTAAAEKAEHKSGIGWTWPVVGLIVLGGAGLLILRRRSN